MCVSDRRFFVDKNNGFAGVLGGGAESVVHIRPHVCVWVPFLFFVCWLEGRHHKTDIFLVCMLCVVLFLHRVVQRMPP